MAHVFPIEQFTAPSWEVEREIANTGATHIEVRVIDPRVIVPEQRMKARAIIGDIALWSGDKGDADYIHTCMKYDFCVANDLEWFSLANTDVTTARLYITYLIDFCVFHGVPLRKPVLEMCDDLEAAAYSCLANRKCLVCGTGGCDVHHVDTIGMGMDRKTVVHVGMRSQALCRIHHTNCHAMGQNDFDKLFHTVAIPLDKYLCLKLGLNFEAD